MDTIHVSLWRALVLATCVVLATAFPSPRSGSSSPIDTTPSPTTHLPSLSGLGLDLECITQVPSTQPQLKRPPVDDCVKITNDLISAPKSRSERKWSPSGEGGMKAPARFHFGHCQMVLEYVGKGAEDYFSDFDLAIRGGMIVQNCVKRGPGLGGFMPIGSKGYFLTIMWLAEESNIGEGIDSMLESPTGVEEFLDQELPIDMIDAVSRVKPRAPSHPTVLISPTPKSAAENTTADLGIGTVCFKPPLFPYPITKDDCDSTTLGIALLPGFSLSQLFTSETPYPLPHRWQALGSKCAVVLNTNDLLATDHFRIADIVSTVDFLLQACPHYGGDANIGHSTGFRVGVVGLVKPRVRLSTID